MTVRHSLPSCLHPFIPSSEQAPPLFRSDEIRAAYHLALLEWPYSGHVAWQRHRGPNGEIDAAVAFYSLSQPPIAFVIGDAAGVGECLAEAELPECAYQAFFPEHGGVLSGFYHIPRPVAMTRMVLGRDDFGNAAASDGGREIVLGARHADALEELYSHEAGLRADRYQFEQGRYVGTFADGKLVAAAGTHFVSRSGSFAMIGNVFTHPGYRRQGLARQVVTGLLRRTFERADRVCLNVRYANRAAVNLYESMGFSAHCTYCEGLALLAPALASAEHNAASGDWRNF